MNWTDHKNAPERGTELCKLQELDPDAGQELVVKSGADPGWPFRMFVVRRGEDVWGYVNTCPHQHIPLNYFPDRFVSQDEQFIQCANHGALFNFDDGKCIAGPCVGETLQRVPLAIRDGVVTVG